MADATWPSNVPFEPEATSYNETMRPDLTTFQPDVGPPTTTRRSTLQSTTIQTTILLTQSEREAWLTFYQTTLANGTLPFTWENPAYTATGRYMFDPSSPPQLASIGFNLYRLNFTVIRLRDAS